MKVFTKNEVNLIELRKAIYTENFQLYCKLLLFYYSSTRKN